MDGLGKTLAEFAADYCEYLPSEIPEIDHVPTPVEFLNDYVNTNLPFVMRCPDPSVYELNILKKWKRNHYLYEIKGVYGDPKGQRLQCHEPITVAVSPNGYADSVHDGKFMVPEERTMQFFKFMDELDDRKLDGIFYVQKQNNNLIEEYPLLLPPVNKEVPWVTEAFDSPPDAANIWIGNRESFSSMHKDHYENLYYVITGSKKFTLIPPIANMWMPYKKYRKFQWVYVQNPVENYWSKEDLKEEVSWIPMDRTPETREKKIMAQNTKSFVVNVMAGEALYIPALWYHEVSQTNRTIALNYWYDMKYDMKYPYFCLLETLSKLPVSRADASVQVEPDAESDEILIREFTDKKKDTRIYGKKKNI